MSNKIPVLVFIDPESGEGCPFLIRSETRGQGATEILYENCRGEITYEWEKCKRSSCSCPLTGIADIKAEIQELKNSHLFNFVSNSDLIDTVCEIIDKHSKKENHV